jgi:HD superfamily phosphodiesterase
MSTAYTESVGRAKKLYEEFYDVIHNWDHSVRVAANASMIADNIGYEDKDFLTLCALWHDAARTRGVVEGHEEAGALLAKKDLLDHGFDKESAERAYTAIRFHKSSSVPTTIEGKIIRDADKLDIFEVKRWQNCAEAGWIKEYADDLRKTVAAHGKYPDAYTYDITKEEFAKKLPGFLDYYNSAREQLPE